MNIESHKHIIKNYIRAKDDNKLHLMKSVFTDSATLEMRVKTDNISFPADTVGLEAITNVLVRNFNQTYENVYTFCLEDSFNNQHDATSCIWLVCMTERDSGNVRVGAGKYDWRFEDAENPLANILATNLVITIEQMLVLEPIHSEQIMEWARDLPYPFCDSERMFASMPDLEPLELIRKFVSHDY